MDELQHHQMKNAKPYFHT